VVVAYAPGIYPRSDALVQATRDLDRGRASAEDVERVAADDLASFVDCQREAGLDLLSDGMLAWQDLFRPLVGSTPGLETGPLTRFLDTNTFFRSPRVEGELGDARPLEPRFFAALDGPRLATLPSPYSFGHAAGVDPKAIAEHVLAPTIASLAAELVVLHEPLLLVEESPDLPALADALDTLADGTPLALQLPFGDAGGVLEALAELPVAGLGVDFYATSFDAVPDGLSKRLLAGVVDARSSVVESPDALAAFVERLAERIDGEVALVPNGDLQFVAEPIAREKIAALGAAKEILVA
jgi:5-methyltetrahydropteroyltriglutamate--homocysteine methyltransferase